MEEQVLIRDTHMTFPEFVVLKASAGSGKTHTLTKRYVQFLLSDKIPHNRLKNMLAITFSNNAAKEMKEKTLSWLKKIHFGNPEEVDALLMITSLEREGMPVKAGILIDEILDSYSDFQIKTIDSFMTTIFKASAIDFGYDPDFDILMNSDSFIEYSFDLFMRDVRRGTEEAAYLGEIVDIMLEQRKSAESYMWDPSAALLAEIKKIYRKLSINGKQPEIEDYSEDLASTKEKISAVLEEIEGEIEGSGLKRHSNSSYKTILSLVRERSFPDLIGKTFANPPAIRPQKGDSKNHAAYDRTLALWADIRELVLKFTVLFARTCCAPYIKAYQSFSKTVDMAKKQQGKVFIEDINILLAEHLSSRVVPDVYFRIGETVFHFLIDEFQDTSPIQWQNLYPLVENSLSQGGSLFAVGDTKQAIYGFRNADYAIMKGMEKTNPFPSADHAVRELGTNYRSKKRILEFNDKVFKERLLLNSEYRNAGDRSGLTDYIQKPRETESCEGYVEVSLLEKDSDEPAERGKIQDIIEELRSRGYRYGDIAVLTRTNEDAVSATTWLNEKDIPFISYSSLDVRRRKITGEIVALMNFLDSPTDDFSFGTFMLGDIFTKVARREYTEIGIDVLREFCFSNRNSPPLYKAFQERFGGLWERFFEGLFKASGFLPTYDLITEILAVFKVFENQPEEEAAIVKLLEVVKDFEGEGFNSLRDFLETALDNENGETKWNMAVPKDIDAVQVMTIHKAKGLGFPVVIVLLYEVKNRGFEYIIEEKDESVCLLKINKNTAACNETLRGLYEKERMSEMVNRLNILYVGFTRPENELYVIGVKSTDKGYPFPLLPADEFLPSGKPGRCSESSLPANLEPPAQCQLFHRDRPLEFSVTPEEFMTVEEKRRGQFIHRVLSLIDFVRDGFENELQAIIAQVNDETNSNYSVEEMTSLVISLTGGKMARHFKEMPGRQVRKEQEYSDGSGRLFRIDRVVIDGECATVIDYKTGRDKEALEKYRIQMRNYMGILTEVYPGKTVAGVIAFVDLGETETL